MKRVNKLYIGYDIARTGALSWNVYGVADNLAEGEIIILDKNKEVVTAGQTISDTDIVYIAVGSKNTFTDANGTARREAIISNPIEGYKVRTFNGESYVAAANKAIDFASTGVTPVVGDEYIVRVMYKDMQNETPAQYVQEWRIVSDTIVLNTLYNDFVTKINADPNSRVVASNVGGALRLTGAVIPFNINQIDGYKLVDFEAFFNHVTPTGPETAGPATTVSTALNMGIGDWRQVRDMEREAKGYFGVTNMITFPVPTAVTDWYVNNGGATTKTYDFIVIEHEASYVSPDLSYNKEARLTSTIALPVNCGQATDILAVLNPWMASTPKAFPAVSI